MSKRVNDKQEEELLNKAALAVVEDDDEKESVESNEKTILRQYLVEEFAERAKKRKEEHEQLMRLNENSRRNAEEFNRRKAEKQASCAHTQPRGETNVRGQYLSSGKLFLTCQRCQKSWLLPDDSQTIPTHLLPSGNDVGQPSLAY